MYPEQLNDNASNLRPNDISSAIIKVEEALLRAGYITSVAINTNSPIEQATNSTGQSTIQAFQPNLSSTKEQASTYSNLPNDPNYSSPSNTVTTEVKPTEEVIAVENHLMKARQMIHEAYAAGDEPQ